MTEARWSSPDGNEDKVAVDRFLDDVGWGALLIAVGALWLVPAGQLPHGTWMIGVGFILLVLNVARYMVRIQVNGLTLIAGTVALLAGVGAVLAIDLPIFPIALVAIGVCWLLGSVGENLHRLSDHEDGTCC